MIIIALLIPLSILLGACFLGAFIWAVRSGQFEDTTTPALRLLTEDSLPKPAVKGRTAIQTGLPPDEPGPDNFSSEDGNGSVVPRGRHPVD